MRFRALAVSALVCLVPQASWAFRVVAATSTSTALTNTKETPPTREEYAALFPELLSSGHDSTAKALNACSGVGSQWMLRAVGMGLALQLQAGLGPILSLTANGEVRLFYSNAKDTPTP